MTVRGFPESEGKGGASRWPSHSRSIALHRSFTVKPRADCSGPLTKVRVRPLSAQHTHAARKHAAYRVSQSERERELHTHTHTRVWTATESRERVARACSRVALARTQAADHALGRVDRAQAVPRRRVLGAAGLHASPDDVQRIGARLGKEAGGAAR